MFTENLKKYKNFLTIIIPRHIHRTEQILINLKKLNLEALKYSKINSANRNVDIIVVDSFGITKSFLKNVAMFFRWFFHQSWWSKSIRSCENGMQYNSWS